HSGAGTRAFAGLGSYSSRLVRRGDDAASAKVHVVVATPAQGGPGARGVAVPSRSGVRGAAGRGAFGPRSENGRSTRSRQRRAVARGHSRALDVAAVGGARPGPAL